MDWKKAAKKLSEAVAKGVPLTESMVSDVLYTICYGAAPSQAVVGAQGSSPSSQPPPLISPSLFLALFTFHAAHSRCTQAPDVINVTCPRPAAR